jgi:Gpi18-like mannosyltransferase
MYNSSWNIVFISEDIWNQKGDHFEHVLYILRNITGTINTVGMILSERKPEVQWYGIHWKLLYFMESCSLLSRFSLGQKYKYLHDVADGVEFQSGQ